MYQFLIKEGRPIAAFRHLCIVAAFDLSDTGAIDMDKRGFKAYRLKSTVQNIAPYRYSIYVLAPYVIGHMGNMQCEMEMSNSDFREFLISEFSRIYIPGRIFTNEEMADIVLNEIGDHPRNLDGIYREAQDRMKKEILSIK